MAAPVKAAPKPVAKPVAKPAAKPATAAPVKTAAAPAARPVTAKAPVAQKQMPPKAPAKQTPPKKPVETEVEVVEEEQLAPEVIEANAADCRERILSAQTAISDNFYELADALAEADTQKYHVQWGFESFEQFCNAELDLGYRKARYLIEVNKAIVAAGLTKEAVTHIGWTKLKEIAAPIQKDPESAGKWLKEAEKKTTKELIDAVRLSKGTPPKPDVLRVSAKFDAEGGKIVSDALSVAYGDINQEDVNAALLHICSEWLTFKGAGGETATAEDYAKFIETRFAVKVTLEELEASDLDEALEPEEVEPDEDADLESGEDDEAAEVDDLLSLDDEE